jgi:hypothetical protein
VEAAGVEPASLPKISNGIKNLNFRGATCGVPRINSRKDLSHGKGNKVKKSGRRFKPLSEKEIFNIFSGEGLEDLTDEFIPMNCFQKTLKRKI